MLYETSASPVKPATLEACACKCFPLVGHPNHTVASRPKHALKEEEGSNNSRSWTTFGYPVRPGK
jgi:hypothetical protein